MSDGNGRPSHEAPLAGAERAARGALRVFLGAAPGVGKTHAMLETAHERRREGVDVVVAVVETHGRPETEALLDGLEVLPRRRFEHGGHACVEMDLDALLARRPSIALVDELAHTNAPGCRHLKRYQDVEEILAAGISVYSTLNVQHLESLNDVVERICGVRIRDTLPDDVLRRADEIELVDLSPEDLLKRLAEGKVCVPEQAGRAERHFFSPANLAALRELALRQTAEQVDAQMLHHMRADAVEGPWPTRERLLVGIGHDVAAERLVRAAKRIADRHNARWTAVYVETDRHHTLPEEAKDRVAQALRLAEQLGGEALVVPGDDVARELLGYAADHNVTQILVGRRRRRGPRWLAGVSATDALLAQAGSVDVLVVGGGGGDARPGPAPWTGGARQRQPWLGIAAALAGTAAVSGLCWLGDALLPLPNIAVAYLMLVLLVAIGFGLRPAIVASAASFFAFNYLFTEPRFTFAVADPENVITLLFFLAAAVITSNLAARVRRQMRASKLSARRTATLYEFSRRISGAATQDDVLWAVVHHVAAMTRGRSLVLLPEDGRLQIRAGYPPEDRLEETDAAAAEWAWTRGVPTGRGSTTLPAASWLFLPMQTVRGPIGVLGVQMEDDAAAPSPETGRLLESLADQAALAIERTNLVADVEQAKLASETERLRTALLSSLSRELQTPIAGILEAAARLAEGGGPAESAAGRRNLALALRDEAERLSRFVQNLLDMTRLGSGALRPRTDWENLRSIVEAALDRAKRLLQERPVRIDIPPDLPRVRVDRTLLEQVFFNLIDNACRYTPAGTRITIWARPRNGRMLIEVSDEGPGIPPADREKVFDMFYRLESAGSPAAGLGLAICRGIVQAHGGRIRVDSGLNGVGTAVCIQLPIGAEDAARRADARAA